VKLRNGFVVCWLSRMPSVKSAEASVPSSWLCFTFPLKLLCRPSPTSHSHRMQQSSSTICSSAQTSPESRVGCTRPQKVRSSRNRCLHSKSDQQTSFNQKKFFTTICACDLAPKHSQAALQLVLIHNQWKIKALQCGRSRQPRSLHPSSLTFRDSEGLIQDEHPFV